MDNIMIFAEFSLGLPSPDSRLLLANKQVLHKAFLRQSIVFALSQILKENTWLCSILFQVKFQLAREESKNTK